MDAPEIIVTVWKKKTEMRQAGAEPERLVLSSANYKKLQDYKNRLGALPHPERDYLQKDSLFGIPVFIDNSCPLSVE
jgi:hypothetical protein